MRIIYVAKHGQIGNSNDDEGAITHALRLLGHTVQEIHENGQVSPSVNGDLFLFHKYADLAVLSKLKMPKVFWYFDLVDWPNDPRLAARCANRRNWFLNVLPFADLGFCTDGDWVAGNHAGAHKLVHLPQGFDTRQKDATVPNQDIDLLFTGIGIRSGGSGRGEWLRRVATLNCNFYHCERGVHGPALAELTARAKITVCPDSPVTDRYWSNRVYNALGFGGFVLHPYCAELAKGYKNNRHLQYYTNPAEFRAKVASWLSPERDAKRRAIAAAGREWTFQAHSYLRRVEILLGTVKERLGVG